MQGNSWKKVEKKLKSETTNMNAKNNKIEKNKRNNLNSISRDYCNFNYLSYNKHKCIVWGKWINKKGTGSKTASK